MHRVVALGFAVAVFAWTAGCEIARPETQGEAVSTRTGKRIVRAVFLYNSNACPCEKDRNAAAEEVIKAVTEGETPAISLLRVDVHREPKELDRYEKTAGIAFLPALIGLDADGNVVGKVEGFFKEGPVAEILRAP